MIATWPCPDASGAVQDEYALAFDRKRPRRLLVIAPLFDEANKLRRQLVEVMRRLDHAGIDCFLPDLPGWNESPRSMRDQTLHGWRHSADAAAAHFRTTHVLAVRAGAIIASPSLPGWRYAPVGGATILRTLLRASIIAEREAGREQTLADLTERGRAEGLELAGYAISLALFTELEAGHLPDNGRQGDIDQQAIGGSGLWLRAEPGFDPAQADALAAFVAMGMLA